MYTVAAFYRFFLLTNPQALRDELHEAFALTDLRGTTLLAPEGINGTMAGTEETIQRFLALLKFKCKREIITFRTDTHLDPTRPGTYVDPANWNALISDPEVLLLDTRNAYETEIGTFANAVTPQLEKFSDFAHWVSEHLNPAEHKKVAMFCTGGIRCEKASAYMLQLGFPEVYHLRGGILRYLQDVPDTESRWKGGCYIFDERVAVNQRDLQAQEHTDDSQ